MFCLLLKSKYVHSLKQIKSIPGLVQLKNYFGSFFVKKDISNTLYANEYLRNMKYYVFSYQKFTKTNLKSTF